MTVHSPADASDATETLAKSEALRHIEPIVQTMYEAHMGKQRLWWPTDFLPSDEKMSDDEETNIAALRERARSVPDSLRVAVVLGMLTEEGLPHFHRLLSKYLGDESVWGQWNYMWTAEEDRHGMILHDYARESRLFRFKEVEMMQYAYNAKPASTRRGTRTRTASSSTRRFRSAPRRSRTATPAGLADAEPVAKRHLLQHRRRRGQALLLLPPRLPRPPGDRPATAPCIGALAVMPAIDMPGVSMPAFKEMADVVRRTGIYGPWDYKAIVEEAIDFWKIETLTGLNDIGRAAQEKILAIPKRLGRVAEYIEQRSTAKSFSFKFIYERAFDMA